MQEHPWFILIYQLADEQAQTRLAAGLNAMGNLTVQADQDNGEYFVTVECSGHVPALTMHELVVSIDSDATLIDTHSGTIETVEEFATD
jgi:hypothetical protein